MNKEQQIQIFSNSLGAEELQAVEKAFASKWLGMGAECKELERELGSHFGSTYTLLLNNCTAGIYVALKALGIGPGDEVIIPTANFVAIPNAVLELGATPVFADVDPDYFNLLPEEVSRLKTSKTKAIFLLHYGGHPARFDEIRQAAGPKILILEDSANAVSSKYKGKHCGALGDAGVFSFDAMKMLVMGDGGALTLQSKEFYERALSYRYLGLAPKTTSGIDSLRQGNNRWWEYEVVCSSGRFISNDIAAAIGRIQLKKLPSFIQRRKEVWAQYQSGLAGIAGLTLPPEPLAETTSSYYLYWLRLKQRDKLAAHLQEKGIYTTFRYYPLHLIKHYGSKAKLPKAEQMNEETINIPLHQNLTDTDAGRIIDTIKSFMKAHG